MNVVIYRKSDLTCVGTVVAGMTIEQEIELNVIPNFGGKYEDYEVLETDETGFHLELFGGVVTIVKDIPATTIPEPTQEDYLLDLDFRLSMMELGF